MNFGKFLTVSILLIIGGFIAFKLVGFLLGWAIATVFKIAIPLLLIVGILYVVYRVTGGKALTGRRNGILP